MGLAVISNFTTEGLTEGSNSETLDPKLDALTTRPRIPKYTFTVFFNRHMDSLFKLNVLSYSLESFCYSK